MKQYRVAILGASGAVGQEMMKILAERKFPVGELHLLASARSAGKVVSWQGQNIALEEATDAAFSGMDIVLGAAENDIAERFAPAIVRSGAVFVDNSSAFRLDPNVPLVVPEINAGDVKLHHGIISNPNCSTIITLTAINALRKLSPIRDMVVSTYQPYPARARAARSSCKTRSTPCVPARATRRRCSRTRSPTTSSRRSAASSATATPPRR